MSDVCQVIVPAVHTAERHSHSPKPPPVTPFSLPKQAAACFIVRNP